MDETSCMSISGRLVPWISWDEWEHVGCYLFDEREGEVRKGLEIVSAWRIRRRVPVGVDATANLREVQLTDALKDDERASDHMIRLQYSLSIVRFVNGVADSAQKGRVAASVASLAQNVGIPRILVDIRHESTHNELPSLSTLRIAADEALKWLRKHYWATQKAHILRSRKKVGQAFDRYMESHILAAMKEDSAENVGDAVAVEYDVRKSKKERHVLLADLRSRVPGGTEDMLIQAFQESSCKVLEKNRATMVACGRAMRQIADEWKNIPSMIVQSYMQSLFQCTLNKAATIPIVWFEVALDLLAPNILRSILTECITKHSDTIYKKQMSVFIDVEIDKEFENSINCLQRACHACIQKLGQAESDFFLEFVLTFLTQPTSRELLVDMDAFIERVRPKRQKKPCGWVKVSEWTPCAIGMAPCSYNTNGVVPDIFVPENHLTTKGTFDVINDCTDKQNQGIQEDEEDIMQETVGGPAATTSPSTGDYSDGICLPPAASYFHSKMNQ